MCAQHLGPTKNNKSRRLPVTVGVCTMFGCLVTAKMFWIILGKMLVNNEYFLIFADKSGVVLRNM